MSGLSIFLINPKYYLSPYIWVKDECVEEAVY